MSVKSLLRIAAALFRNLVPLVATIYVVVVVLRHLGAVP